MRDEKCRYEVANALVVNPSSPTNTPMRDEKCRYEVANALVVNPSSPTNTPMRDEKCRYEVANALVVNPSSPTTIKYSLNLTLSVDFVTMVSTHEEVLTTCCLLFNHTLCLHHSYSIFK